MRCALCQRKQSQQTQPKQALTNQATPHCLPHGGESTSMNRYSKSSTDFLCNDDLRFFVSSCRPGLMHNSEKPQKAHDPLTVKPNPVMIGSVSSRPNNGNSEETVDPDVIQDTVEYSAHHLDNYTSRNKTYDSIRKILVKYQKNI